MCIKDTNGVGKQIVVQFYAPIDESSPEAAMLPIPFQCYKQYPSELSLLEQGNYEEYCYK
jgi:hypothetical protein